MPAFAVVTSDIIAQLQSIAGVEQVSIAQADLALRARDQSHHAAHPGDVVVWPQTGQQVADILRLANACRIPVTPWGMGTSLEGNPIPLYGGILLSLERMTRIVAVHADDFQVTVEPGIGHKDLNAALARHGLFFGPDPGANASIGGMLANNAAGIRTVKYGASKDNVLQMRVALADGRLIRVGSRSVKQSAGYDLLHLFVGSEGTLGVITEATLKLYPIVEHMGAALAAFDSVADAVQAVVAIRGSGLDPAALEFMDAAHATMLREAEGVNLSDHATLFMEFHTPNAQALETGLSLVGSICEELGAVSFRATTDPAERRRLWHARHASYEISVRKYPDQQFYLGDVAVPISAYPALVQYIEQVRTDYGVPLYLIGHAGDGNIHVELPYATDEEYARCVKINGLIVRQAQDLGGTATGEHGVGIGKARHMRDEHGEALDVMYDIKRLLDPNGILNPGKIFPGHDE
ncbi:MAG: FAD-binding oxidoreductase [Anaerolineae bacterium]|nr:FAD-binding oxidoreductase [Anaerolineae bacterium]